MGRRIVYVALFMSLALNVFIVGAFVGARLTERPQRAEIRPRNPIMLAVRELSPEHQAAWRAGLPTFARTYGPKTREARRLAREAMAGLGDEPFDADAKLADLARARALEHESRTAMDRRIVTFAETLPPEERARFGAALARPAIREALGGGPGDRGRPALADR